MGRSAIRGVRFTLGAVALAAAAVSFVSYFNIEHNRWEPAYLVPSISPPGRDFREGLYEAAERLVDGESLSVPYPPFNALLATPFVLLDIDVAYYVQVGILYALNIACLWLALSIARFVNTSARTPGPERHDEIAFPLFLLVSLLMVSSYGFIFSLERGNWDIYAQLAALGGLWLMVRKPKWLWPTAICFSIAAHLKVYPAILFLLLVWQHGWRSLVPLLVVNAGLFLSTGLNNAVRFFELVTGFAQAPYLWQGNHSAASFASMVNGYLEPRGLGPIPAVLFYVLPAGLWLFACVYLLRRRFSAVGAAWLFMLSVPMMSLIPSVSHDYKLVLLGAPLAMAFLFLAQDLAISRSRVRALQVVLLAGLATFLGLSYTRLPVILGNKYPFVLAFQAALLWVLVTPVSQKKDSLYRAGAQVEAISTHIVQTESR